MYCTGTTWFYRSACAIGVQAHISLMTRLNTVKVSYSCINNMSKIIKAHNKKVALKPHDQRPKCNCRKKGQCPTEENCLVNDVVYKCDLTRPLPKKVHLGLAEGEWKSHFYKHKLSFKHKRYSTKTTLSSYMLHLKIVSSETPNLKWSVLRCVPPYSNISKKCIVFIWKTGISYLPKPEGTLEQEIWTPL